MIPSATYKFHYSEIFFSTNIFIIHHKNILEIFAYPNIRLKNLKVNKKIKQIIFNPSIKIITEKNKTIEINDLKIEHNQNTFFKHKNDMVYYENVALFKLDGTFDIIIDEKNFKLFKHYLEENIFIVEEYPLFIVKNRIFDVNFFSKYKLQYDNILLDSNGNDFAICIENLITINMKRKLEIDENISHIKMGRDFLIIESTTSLYFFDMDLNEKFKQPKNRYLYNYEEGMIFLEKEAYYHVTTQEIYKIKERYLILDFYYTYKTNNESININRDIYQHYDQNQDILKNRVAELTLEKDHINFENYKIEFTKQNNRYLFYYYSFKKLKLFNFNIFHNNTLEDAIFDYEILSDAKIENILHFNAYKNRCIVVTTDSIYLKVNNLISKTKNKYNIINICAKEYKICHLENKKINEIVLYEMIFSLQTKIKFEINFDIKQPLERFLFKLLLHRNQNYMNLINNLHDEDIICKLYRKGDDGIRQNLLDCLPKNYFHKLQSAENILYVLNFFKIDLEYFKINVLFRIRICIL